MGDLDGLRLEDAAVDAGSLAPPTADEKVQLAEESTRHLFLTPAGRTDPYPHYDRMRQCDPVHHSKTLDCWLLSRYDDCKSVLRDPRFGRGFADTQDVWHPGWRDRPAFDRAERLLLNLDPPAHSRLRKLVSRRFTGRTVAAMSAQLDDSVEQLLERLISAGRGDVVSELAMPLALGVIGDLLGIPPSDRRWLPKHGSSFTAVLEVATPSGIDQADHAADILCEYFGDFINSSAKPEKGLIGEFVGAANESGSLAPDDIVGLALLLFVAGFENATNAVTNSVLALATHPDQFQGLADDPTLMETAPDELIRFDSSVQFTIRMAAETVALGQQPIAPGEPIVVLLGAANRDPERFPAPCALELHRSGPRTLGFGGGIHHCVGHALARAEVDAVTRQFAKMVGSIEVADQPHYPDRLAIRGPVTAPISISAKRTRRRTPTTRSVDQVAHEPSPAPTHAPSSLRPASGDDHQWRAAFRASREQAPTPEGEDLQMLVDLLGRVPLFSGCTTAELQTLGATMYPIDFEPGEVLFTEGGAASDCLVVAEGEAIVSHDGATVAVVGPDKVIGERGVLLHSRRSATVTARTHMVTHAIARERLLKLVAGSPTAREAMRRDLQSRYGDEVGGKMAIPLPQISAGNT